MKITEASPMVVDVYAKVIYKDGKTKDMGCIYTDSKGIKGKLIKLREKWRRMIWLLRKGSRL